MSDPEITRLVLAVLIQAPFAFRLGAVVRDGRELSFGLLFLAVGSAFAALAAFLAQSLLIGIGAALAAVFFLAHARFVAARRALSARCRSQAPPPVSTYSADGTDSAPSPRRSPAATRHLQCAEPKRAEKAEALRDLFMKQSGEQVAPGQQLVP